MNTSWDLTRICPTQEGFEKGVAWCKEVAIPGIASFKGKLGTEEGLKGYFELNREINEKVSKVYEFASMRSDLDKRNTKNVQDLARIRLAYNDIAAADSYSQPEILALGKDYMDSFFKRNPEYRDFDYQMEKLFNSQKYVLDGEKEGLLSNFSNLSGAGSSLYSTLSVADAMPKTITLSDGRELTVTQSNWTYEVENAKCEADRTAIFEALYSFYDERKNTYGEIYAQVLNAEIAEMKSRGFKSVLEEHLAYNKIPTTVFTNLVEVASTNTKALKKYYELKRKYLGLEKYHTYDRFVQLVHSDTKYEYQQALNLFYNSLESLYTDDYKAKAREVTKEGYVDVYPGPAKRSGAYSSGGSGVHPYILLNYNGGLDDVFTLAHESGHSVHTLYTMEAQPISKQDYTIFVAEIASTFNEHNLLDYLMQKGDMTKNDKIFLLQKAIDEICSTFYRQTLFAHFEWEAAKKAEAGEPINHEVLSQIMEDLYKQYYGLNIREEKYKQLVWAYIPHLYYTPFYVYQYATSFTASMLIYENVKAHKPGAFDSYINMLKMGGSKYPIDEVKSAGVDLTTKEPFLAVTRRMEYLVDELEKVLAE